MNADELAQQIVDARKLSLSNKIKRSPRRNSVMSDISDCRRQMVYAVLDWDKRLMFDESAIGRMESGDVWEKEIIKGLLDYGFDVTGGQNTAEIKNSKGETIATGRIDGFVGKNRERMPFEIKALSPHIFARLNSIEDFRRTPWTRKYLRQLMLYMFANNHEQSIFIITDRAGSWKVIPLYLDYTEAEVLLQTLEVVHENIKAKTYPERILYDKSICGKCPFAQICLPDIINKPADMIDNVELESDLDRHEELKPLASEYDSLHDKIKQIFKGIAKAVVGTRYLIMSVPSERMTYELTPEAEEQIKAIKAEFAKKVPMERLVIECLDKKEAVA